MFYLYAARAARGLGDGFAAIILPTYLTRARKSVSLATMYDLHHARNGQTDWWTALLQNACSSDYPALETDE
jgi:hypothetical protein